jgi:hypothetical protein
MIIPVKIIDHRGLTALSRNAKIMGFSRRSGKISAELGSPSQKRRVSGDHVIRAKFA